MTCLLYSFWAISVALVESLEVGVECNSMPRTHLHRQGIEQFLSSDFQPCLLNSIAPSLCPPEALLGEVLVVTIILDSSKCADEL